MTYAENGADIVVTDICETPDFSKYELSGEKRSQKPLRWSKSGKRTLSASGWTSRKESDV